MNVVPIGPCGHQCADCEAALRKPFEEATTELYKVLGTLYSWSQGDRARYEYALTLLAAAREFITTYRKLHGYPTEEGIA